MRTSLVAVMVFTALLFAGCASISKTMVPFQRSSVVASAPVVQELLAGAVAQAVEQATKSADWKAGVRGRKVSVEIQGVLPMGDSLFSFVKAALEAELARAGAIVVAPRAASVTIGQAGLTSSTSEPDFRVVASLSAGGIDSTRMSELDGLRFGFQVGLMAGGVAAGIFLVEPLEAFSAIPAGVLILGGGTWMVLAPPIRTTWTLTSRVTMRVYVLPQSGGGGFADLAGTGSKEIVIPGTPDGPYVLLGY